MASKRSQLRVNRRDVRRRAQQLVEQLLGLCVLALLHQRARQRQARVEAAGIRLGRVGRDRHGVVAHARERAGAPARHAPPRRGDSGAALR